MSLQALPGVLIETVNLTAALMLLPASAACSFAMAVMGIPTSATSNILAIFKDAIMAPLIICALLLVDCFADTEPAILILPPSYSSPRRRSAKTPWTSA
ncbi:hypothetical protein [Paracoccus marcusii]|uniref:hypothetical protein n=1 Tax=Paracoccus marcusii TaxID=59779 RepID=UPI0035A6D250